MAVLVCKLSDFKDLDTTPKSSVIKSVNYFEDIENEDPVDEGECILVLKEHPNFTYSAVYKDNGWLIYPIVISGKEYTTSDHIEMKRVYVIDKICKLNEIDELTGFVRQNKCMELFKKELERSNRENLWCSVILLDLDNFKKINDKFGLSVGNYVLKECSKSIRIISRSYDILCRWGGDEFLLVYPNTDREEVVLIGERLRKQISKKSYIKNDKEIRVSASMSALTIDNFFKNLTPDFIFKYLDKFLKKSKMFGKDNVIIPQQITEDVYNKYKDLL